MNLSKHAFLDTKKELAEFLTSPNGEGYAYNASRTKLEDILKKEHAPKAIRTQLRFMDKSVRHWETASAIKKAPMQAFLKNNPKFLTEDPEACRKLWGYIEYQKKTIDICTGEIPSAFSIEDLAPCTLANWELDGFSCGGYTGTICKDPETGKHYGWLLNVTPFITYEADTLESLKKEILWTMARTPIEKEDMLRTGLFFILQKFPEARMQIRQCSPYAEYISICQNTGEFAEYNKAQNLLSGSRTTADHYFASWADARQVQKEFL